MTNGSRGRALTYNSTLSRFDNPMTTARLAAAALFLAALPLMAQTIDPTAATPPHAAKKPKVMVKFGDRRVDTLGEDLSSTETQQRWKDIVNRDYFLRKDRPLWCDNGLVKSA